VQPQQLHSKKAAGTPIGVLTKFLPLQQSSRHQPACSEHRHHLAGYITCMLAQGRIQPRSRALSTPSCLCNASAMLRGRRAGCASISQPWHQTFATAGTHPVIVSKSVSRLANPTSLMQAAAQMSTTRRPQGLAIACTIRVVRRVYLPGLSDYYCLAGPACNVRCTV
jgi:hypothetical protein